jgi:hypothetical protein
MSEREQRAYDRRSRDSGAPDEGAQDTRPRLMQIYRDFLKPGAEASYKSIEEEAASVCIRLGCPHPHLAMESLTMPAEVWWLNAFVSTREREEVVRQYEANPAFLAALAGISQRKEGLIEPHSEVLTTYRQDLSQGVAWEVAGARLVVVTVSRADPSTPGAVFEAEDGTRFSLRPVRTRQKAEAVARAVGPEARIFVIRPYWGMPAKQWITADSLFWRVNPMARVG